MGIAFKGHDRELWTRFVYFVLFLTISEYNCNDLVSLLVTRSVEMLRANMVCYGSDLNGKVSLENRNGCDT